MRLAAALPAWVLGPRLAMGHLGMADWVDVSTYFLVGQEGEFVWQKWVAGLRDYSGITIQEVMGTNEWLRTSALPCAAFTA